MKRSTLFLSGGALVLGFFLVGSVLVARLALGPTGSSAPGTSEVRSLSLELTGQTSTRALTPGEEVSLDLGAVTSLETSGSWKVTLVPGPAGHATLRAPEASAYAIVISGHSGTLSLRISDRAGSTSWSGRDQAVLEISAPGLNRIQASGTANFALEGLKTPQFDLELSGAGSVKGSGTVDNLVLALSGASSVDFGQVSAQNIRVEGSGAGALAVFSAGGSVEGSLSGAVNLRIGGTPSSVRVETSGMAAVTRS